MLTQERGNASRVNMLAQPELADIPSTPSLSDSDNDIIPIASRNNIKHYDRLTTSRELLQYIASAAAS